MTIRKENCQRSSGETRLRETWKGKKESQENYEERDGLS